MEVVTGGKEGMKAPIVYNPNLKYTWTPEDTFVLTGEQFGAVVNALRAIVNSPEANKFYMAANANAAMDQIMANAVENGIVKEVVEKK